MRRLVIVSSLALALTVAGCTSASTTKRTVTVVNTVTNTSTAVSGPKSSVGVIVVNPSGTPTTAASTPMAVASTPVKTTAPPTTKQSVAPVVKVDPLKADCASMLAASDVKAAIGATIGANNNRVRLGAADRGATGAIRCLYGSKDAGKTAPVRIRLTQYSSAAAAKKQLGVDVQTAQDAGAAVTTPTVDGNPASLQLMAGGLVELQYDTWTMSLAVSDKLATNAKLTTGLPQLAGEILTRLLKNG
jgi:hypothetical protein